MFLDILGDFVSEQKQKGFYAFASHLEVIPNKRRALRLFIKPTLGTSHHLANHLFANQDDQL
ncbi:hypothetical protein J14TS2_22970 [Bacillus sp. J14TS2]|nr:hypothetical protein J14TS2_22970 [Bacillus sp. J14TS2]